MSLPAFDPSTSTVAFDRPEVRLSQRVASLQRRAGTVRSGLRDVDEPVDCLIVTAAGHGPDLDGTGRGRVAAPEATAALRATAARTIVVVSSALVYGAWADNPVPLTEDAPLRPRPGATQAQGMCELERVAHGIRAERPGVTVAVLRPVVCVDPDVARRVGWRRVGAAPWLERSLWNARSDRGAGDDRPAQYLHLDDLARAVEHARLHRLDGVFNVAPPGWLTAGEQLDLVGTTGPMRVPGPVRRAMVAARWREGAGPAIAEVMAYTEHPWVVSSDRLRATGWRASYTNEEAFVLGHRPGWWSTLTPDQRQTVSLGALAATVAGVLWALAGAARGRFRRRRPRPAAAAVRTPRRRSRGATGPLGRA